LDVEVLDERTIGRVHGAKDNDYTAGVICAKVARYAEREHHAERLLHPLRRTGAKGSGKFERVSWDDALDLVAEKFIEAERRFGAESVWPYYYAGTMGLVMRDGINRLRHVKKYSGFHSTICVNPAYAGYAAGIGRIAGVDPREMAKSDLVIIWGTNAVNTQVNVMTHAVRARKERGAKIAAVDIYMNGTMEQADLPVLIKPGTDGALACAVMHCLFRDGKADWDYLEKYTDAPRELEAHLRSRDPQWAAAITGAPVETIEAFARLIGETKRAFFRLGYGFSRSRNGPVNMHAASCIPAVTGAWQYEGGGAFHISADIFRLDKTLIEGLDVCDRSVRMLDQSRIGAILTGEREALHGGAPVTAMIIQNTNPVSVCPDQTQVKRGFAREDLFVCVHEQFMTETAQVADVVLPATTFLEHDDIYRGGGHQYLILGPKLVEPPGECRSNHEVICGLAQRLCAEHRGFTMSPPSSSTRCCRCRTVGRLPRSRPTSGSTASLLSENRTILMAFRGRTGSSGSNRTGRTFRSVVPARAAQLRTCRGFPTTGRRSKSRMASIHFGSRRPRHAASSIRPLTRRRRRWRRKNGLP